MKPRLAWCNDVVALYGGGLVVDVEGYNFDFTFILDPFLISQSGVLRDVRLALRLELPALIVLPTRDGEEPPVDSKFFYNFKYLVEEIAEERENRVRIFVSCTGGNGRTGTMLAALIWYLSDFKEMDPIGYLRTHYSKTAVETWRQINWLKSEGVPVHGHDPSRRESLFNRRWL